MSLRIDRGIPIPAHSQGMNGYRAAIATMSEGDSVFFENEKQAKGFARAMRDSGFTTKMAKVIEKTEDGKDRRGTRVWKGEPKVPPSSNQ